MARSFKYFHDVELLYPSDEFQTLWIFNMFTCSYSIPWYMCPTRSWGLNLNMWSCWRSKVFEICQILLLLFCLNKDQFWFLLMLRTSSAEVRLKKKMQGKTNCSALNTVTGVSKVANKKYLPYLQLCGKALMIIFMYCGCKSGQKLSWNNKNWGLPQDTNKVIFTKYYVRTGIPRY